MSNKIKTREDLVAKIRGFSLLEKGWDGYYAHTINDAVISRAVDSIQKLLDYSGVGLEGLHVVHCPSGSIQFEWHLKNWHMEVKLLADEERLEVFQYLSDDPKRDNDLKPVECECDISDDNISVIASSLRGRIKGTGSSKLNIQQLEGKRFLTSQLPIVSLEQ